MKIILVQSDDLEDWYTIEKAEHENRTWLEQTEENCFSFMDSARISDACVEGTAIEMLEIAKAIKERRAVSFRRCAVDVVGDEVRFRSPRNSRVDGVVSLAEADELAEQILRELGQ